MKDESPLVEQHRAAGAAIGTWFGTGLPTRFGDAAAEHRLARRNVGLFDTNFRAVFSLTGPDRVRYLNAVLTSNIRDLASGQGEIGLLLNAQGHILAELETLALDDRLLALGHRSVREKTGEILEKFIIMDDATLTDQTAETGTLAVEGLEAPAVVRELTQVEIGEMAAHSHAATKIRGATGDIPCRVIHHSLYGFPGAEFLLRRDDLPVAWAALADAVARHGGAPVGYDALSALRLEAGVPWFGTDFDEHQIPHEAGLETTHINFTKGCYTGQEIVERVRSRGHVNRRLIGLRFETSEAPPRDTAVMAEGKEAGKITSTAYSPLLGTAIGMAYLRTESARPGAVLQCGATNAEVIPLPLKGATSH